jgi:hypothetical protein
MLEALGTIFMALVWIVVFGIIICFFKGVGIR